LKKKRSENVGESEVVKAKKDSKDHRKNGGGGGQKKKSSERREAKQDEREAMTTGSDPAPHDTSSGGTKAEDGKPSRHNDDDDDAGTNDALHPPTPWPGRLHGQNNSSSGTVRTTATSSKRESGDAAGGEPADKPNRRKEKRHEKEAAASPEVKPHAEPAHASPPSDKRQKEERRKEERRTDHLKVEACEQQRRASSELLRGHKEKGRAFWNKERTPRRGILVRSLSAEQLPTTSHKSSQGCLDGDVVPPKRKKAKKHKRKALQDEGVKFDKVVVRHYPREVAIGGCMLDPDQGPFLGRLLLPPSSLFCSLSFSFRMRTSLTLLSFFVFSLYPLGIGWDWKQEEVHNLYSFERLRDPDRTHVARAIPSMARQALLVQYGLNEDEIREMIAEMRRKDKELLRGGSIGILPSFWPWKKAG
jgi:hypothetical protein